MIGGTVHRNTIPTNVPEIPSAVHRSASHRDWQRSGWNVAEWFILSQTFLPAILYLPGSQPLRVPIRMASYGISLVVLAYYWIIVRPKLRRSFGTHPAVPWLVGSLICLGFMLLHPTTNSYAAGLAQIGMYFSILTPIFWAPAFVSTPAHLRRLLWLLLVCNGINSFVGVMQAHDPGTWMPKEFSAVVANSEFGLASLSYIGADGHRVLRPPGLSDSPGGVCGPAIFAMYFGLVFAVADQSWWKKVLAATFATLGAAAIFLTLVRSGFLIAVGMVVVYILLQIGQGRIVRASVLLVSSAGLVAVAFLHSANLGGEVVTARFYTILEQNPKDFYMENRGGMVSQSFSEMLPKYPLGAGLGRWGMMNYYFGDPKNVGAPTIWVEVQFPAWIVDGGVVLLTLYVGAIIVTSKQQLRLAFRHWDKRVRLLSSVVFAGNAGLIALCFSYPVFLSPVGIQFWFLSGALYGIAHQRRQRGLTPRPPTPDRDLLAARTVSASLSPAIDAISSNSDLGHRENYSGYPV